MAVPRVKPWLPRRGRAEGGGAAARSFVQVCLARSAFLAVLVAISLAVAASPGWALPPAGVRGQEARVSGSQQLAARLRPTVAHPRRARQASASVARRAHIAGEYGVLPESPAPLIDTSHEEDPLLERLVTAVQAADGRRGVDISAFWIREGSEIVVIITALSRPQLQAIAADIDVKMRKQLRLKRQCSPHFSGTSIRDEAASGWVCSVYPRITIHVMTPTQRSYYDIESTWRDDNQDYEKIPVDELIREDGFGNMRLTKELVSTAEETDYAEAEDEEEEMEEQGVKVGDAGVSYEEDEEDPFWS